MATFVKKWLSTFYVIESCIIFHNISFDFSVYRPPDQVRRRVCRWLQEARSVGPARLFRARLPIHASGSAHGARSLG